MQFYDKENIDTLVLPSSPLATIARHYWVPLIEEGVSLAVRQVQASCALVVINEKIIPIVINEGTEYCSIISSSCYFFLSGAAAYSKSNNPFLKIFFGCMKLFHRIARALKFDHSVQINQWLLPTNPVLELSQEEVERLIPFLKNKYPAHALVWKGVTAEYTQESLRTAVSLGARLLKMRWLYMWDKSNVSKKQERNLRRDVRVLEGDGYTFDENVSKSDSESFKKLYTQLYRDKHSQYSPEYTSYFFERLIESDFFKPLAARNREQVDAFYFYADNGPILMMGIVGYNTQLPQTFQLYPRLMRSATLQSEQHDKPICVGAGSGHFKCNRGAKPINEYDACFVEHLPWSQRMLWILFSKCTQSKLMDFFIREA